MRFKALLIAAVAAMTASPAMSAGYGDFTGDWRNEDAGTSSITRVRINPTGGGLRVRVWGQCSPSDCDWGAEQAVAYSPSPGANPASSATDLTVNFNPGFAETTLILSDRPGDRLAYTIFTRFTDGSGRRPYVTRGALRKHFGGWPGWPPGGGGGGGWPPGGGGGGGGWPPGGGGGGAPGLTLFEHINYGGGSVHINVNTPNLDPMGWNDVASSLRVSGAGEWEVCEHVNYAGRCRIVGGNLSNLVPGGWNDVISSARRVGGPGGGGGGGGGGWPPGGGGGAPVTHSTGLISIPQTFSADLDEGNVTSNASADIWFHAVTAWERYLEPRNGARMWLGDGSNRNLAGCAAGGPYSPAAISLDDLPVGTYVCVRTNGGRYSQFRVNNLSGGSPATLTIGYTTWE